METCEQDAVDHPANVLAVNRIEGLCTLAIQRHRVQPEAFVRREEQRPQHGEPLQRIEGTVVRPVTISPFVVTRDVDERMRERVEQVETVVEHRVAAQRASVLEIIIVHDEGERAIRIDLGQDIGKLLVPFRAIRHVTDQRKAEMTIAGAYTLLKMGRRAYPCRPIVCVTTG